MLSNIWCEVYPGMEALHGDVLKPIRFQATLVLCRKINYLHGARWISQSLKVGCLAAFIYILECGDGTLYSGWTNDVSKRLTAHNAGTGAKYTRSRLPVRLVFVEEHVDRSTAMRREIEVKKMSRTQKLSLIAGSPHLLASFHSAG